MPTRRQAIWWGEARASGTPRYWEGAAVAEDNGVPIPLVAETVPLFPAGRAGECVFRMVYLAVTHVASATLSITPTVIGTLGDLSAGSATFTPKVITLVTPQQMGEPATTVYPIPLVGLFARGGTAQFRSSLRGAGLQLRIETVDDIGAGMLTIDGVELEFEVVKKAQHESVTA